MDKIKLIVKRPYEPVGRVETVPFTLEQLQKMVGGWIEAVPVSENVRVICDEEGRLKGKPYNCTVNGINFVGSIIVCGEGRGDFADVPITLAEWAAMLDEL